MRKYLLSLVLVPGMICTGLYQASSAVIIDPALVSGSNAIDPAGEQTVDQVASGAVPIVTLEAVPELAAVQDFTGWGIQGTTTYIVFSDPTRPDVKGTYSNLTGSTAGGSTGSTSLETSPGNSIKLNSGATKPATLTLDFGSATYSGTGVSAFDSTAMAPTAVGFTVSGLANVTVGVTVNFYGTDDTTLLTSQTLLTGTDPDSGDGTTYGSDGYVGYIASGTGVASGIGKVTIVTNQVVGSSAGVGIDDLAFNTIGTSYYMTVSGSGAKTGTSWATALSGTSMTNLVNSVMVPGDRLYLGSGNYGTSNLGGTTNGQLVFNSSGSNGRSMYLIGVDTGSGLPIFDSGTAAWRRQFPSQGFYNYLAFSGSSSASYWEIDNLVLKDAQKALTISAATGAPHHTGIVLNNIAISNVEHGMYIYNSDNMTINNCSVLGYTKHAFRLEYGCNTVDFTDCTADMTNGDTTWWDYSENFPEGFVVNNGGDPNINISFTDCLAQNNQKNGQANATFWNGDGWDTENNTQGLSLTRCISINNEDGGFDSKQATTSMTTFTDCVSIGNGNNFKVWSGAVNFDNCVSTYPRKPTSTGTNTNTNDVDGLEVVNATVTADYFTFYGSGGTGVAQKSGTGSYNVTNGIIAFSGTAGTFKTVSGGSGTFAPSTVTFRPGSGTDPLFVNPSPTWDGIGTDMNSNTYTTTKGYYSN